MSRRLYRRRANRRQVNHQLDAWLLAQGLLAHPPVGGRPEATIAQVRTRGR